MVVFKNVRIYVDTLKCFKRSSEMQYGAAMTTSSTYYTENTMSYYYNIKKCRSLFYINKFNCKAYTSWVDHGLYMNNLGILPFISDPGRWSALSHWPYRGRPTM